MAISSHTCQMKTGSDSPQVPTKTVENHMENKVRNEEIRRKTGLRKLELIIKERRLGWLGYVLRVEDSRGDTRGSWDDQGKTGWTLSDEI